MIHSLVCRRYLVSCQYMAPREANLHMKYSRIHNFMFALRHFPHVSSRPMQVGNGLAAGNHICHTQYPSLLSGAQEMRPSY